MPLVNTCIACSAPIAQPAGSGRRRLYCSPRCRKAAYRARRRCYPGLRIGPTPPLELEAADVLDDLLGLPKDPDDAVASLVMCGWALVTGLQHTAPRARRQLAWRCEAAAERLSELLNELFVADPQRTPRPRA